MSVILYSLYKRLPANVSWLITRIPVNVPQSRLRFDSAKIAVTRRFLPKNLSRSLQLVDLCRFSRGTGLVRPLVELRSHVCLQFCKANEKCENCSYRERCSSFPKVRGSIWRFTKELQGLMAKDKLK